MRAIIRLEVPEFQIGKEVFCYFKDTMSINGICEKAEPCEDCISREATVKRLCKVAEFMNEKRNGLGSPYIMAALFIQDNKDEFPPVQPKQRTGHWIKTIGENGVTSAVRCSECSFEDNRYMLFKYCPNCGAKMEVDE